MSDTKIARIDNLDPDLIDQFLRTRKSASIPLEVQEYLIKVDAVPQIVHHTGASMTRVIKELQRRFKGLSYSQAREIYYDAMNFFHVDSTISAEAWDNYYAEQFDNLGRLSIAMGKGDTARRCFERAHQLRIAAAERITPEEWKIPVFIISNKISHKDLGFEKKSILDIQRKDEDGYYIKLINSLEISDSNKKRLLDDANIQEVEYEEVNKDADDTE